ncbi:DUF885 domain-containing protein [Klugiella xanthotipulae]|uniref:Uncharacterized protein (DUF885 family) n=1 Tax=Klugiella xanthotipulae TaxID=244735 RepID=A0A543HT68_9MICO|nr:DUF885 domain-containing protein [Klugiella xanthotipulae]TQM61508.1 uncharacterized protein (DUF885 family) [Klugiella xanthotipulae]
MLEPDPSQNTPHTPAARLPTHLDRLAESWLTTQVAHNPALRVQLGLSGATDEYANYSPSGSEQAASDAASARALVRQATVSDQEDEVTRRELLRTFDDIQDSYDAGLHLSDVNNIASPVQDIRDVFDLMPTGTIEDWAAISRRLNRVPLALDGYRETLTRGLARGATAAQRQVKYASEQASEWSQPGGFFGSLTARAHPGDGSEVPPSLRHDLETAAQRAADAYSALATFLSDIVAPASRVEDAVGRDRYSIASRRFLGATIDLDETYEWGLAELARIVDEQKHTATEIRPGVSVHEAISILDADPARIICGTEALREWMQSTSDRAVAELGAAHFDIPDTIRRLECMIAPTQTGGIYYTAPSADLSRPGQMWWSVPPGVTKFTTWRELTTVYHEGVPGHHLQLAQTVVSPALNEWRRLANWTSGHGEGWALYAERLMGQLGYLDDPGDRLGMLDGQRMRAARVVLDIGVHLGKQRPDGTGRWDYDYAIRFMRQNSTQSEGSLRFEVNRYFGWPGQAPSYSIGQRIWEQLRDDYLTHGTLREFHSEALALGGLGLDTLRSALTPR